MVRFGRLTTLGEEHRRWIWRRCGRRAASSARPHHHAVTEGRTS
jgi:hypothetical protein